MPDLQPHEIAWLDFSASEDGMDAVLRVAAHDAANVTALRMAHAHGYAAALRCAERAWANAIDERSCDDAQGGNVR